MTDERTVAVAFLKQAIEEGLASGPGRVMDAAEWKKLWAEADAEFERLRAATPSALAAKATSPPGPLSEAERGSK